MAEDGTNGGKEEVVSFIYPDKVLPTAARLKDQLPISAPELQAQLDKRFPGQSTAAEEEGGTIKVTSSVTKFKI
jgi:hypothetical protein